MSKTLKQFIVENAPEQVAEERMPERDVMAHKIDPETWQDNIIGADEVKRHAGGEFTFYRGFYYRHGMTSQKHADDISTQLDKLGIKHTVVDHNEKYGTPFKGGASVTKQDHFSARVKIHPGQAARIGEDGGIQRQVEEQQVAESEKPFVAVKLDKAGGTSYTVVKSTHGSFKPGDKLSDSDYDELESAHNDGDVHFENLSKKGSGPSSKPGYFGRKSFRT